MSIPKPTKQTALKVLGLLKHGLSGGLGKPEPGKMCVEAAVCYALGLPHGDDPKCVSRAVRRFKIGLNDCNWSSKQARGDGLRELAVAQLGSNTIDDQVFLTELRLQIVRRVLPMALRAASSQLQKANKKEQADALEAAAIKCEAAIAENAQATAIEAKKIAAAAYAAAAYAAYDAYAADAAYDAYAAAAYAAYAACDAYAAAAYAAYAADAAYDAYAAARDEVLRVAAECGVAALKKAKSPGCKWLPLCKEAQ